MSQMYVEIVTVEKVEEEFSLTGFSSNCPHGFYFMPDLEPQQALKMSMQYFMDPWKLERSWKEACLRVKNQCSIP